VPSVEDEEEAGPDAETGNDTRLALETPIDAPIRENTRTASCSSRHEEEEEEERVPSSQDEPISIESKGVCVICLERIGTSAGIQSLLLFFVETYNF
jgi:hypothetical protein